MRPRAVSRTEQAGFTLIEMIVALALLALVAGLLAGTVRSTRNVMAAIERINAASAVLPAQTYLRSALAQTLPARQSALIGDLTPGLSGGPSGVRFKTFFAPRGQLEGVYRIGVGLEPMPDRSGAYNLIVTQTLLRPAPADGSSALAPSLTSTLASNVAAVSFRYFGVEDGANPGPPHWLEQWSSAEQLPRLVEAGVTFANGQPQNWQRLEFPLQLAN